MKPYSYSPYDQETRRLLPHVIKAFTMRREISRNDLLRKYIMHDGVRYTLILTDSLIRMVEATKLKTIVARVSFQHHTDENIAIVNTHTAQGNTQWDL